jgi:hypothetical protein
MTYQTNPEDAGKINRLAVFLAVARNNPALQEHIINTDKERLLRELEMWYGLSESDIKESIGWLQKEGSPEGFWVWW